MTQFARLIAERLNISEKNVDGTLKLLDEGCTIPFIARYRKERTGGLDEVQISAISDQYERLKELQKRKETVVKTITELGKLTPELEKRINDTWGHLEGDNALVTLAGILKKACGPFKKRPFIARYGGDEFIVVMEGFKEDVEALCGLIQKATDDANRSIKAYDILLSIGEAEWRDGMSPKEVIAEADRKLYIIKNGKKGQSSKR